MTEPWITLAAFEIKEAIGDSGEPPKPHTTNDIAEIIERRYRAGAPAAGSTERNLSLEDAEIIAVTIIEEVLKLQHEGYTHFHKTTMARMIKVGVDAALAGTNTDVAKEKL